MEESSETEPILEYLQDTPLFTQRLDGLETWNIPSYGTGNQSFPGAFYFDQELPRLNPNIHYLGATYKRYRTANVLGFRSPEIHGTLNDVAVAALPDWGSSIDAISETFARRHGMDITTHDTCSIPLLGGHFVESIGTTFGSFKFNGQKCIHNREFHVLRKSLHDVILGNTFLQETESLTEHSHRIVYTARPCIQQGKRLFVMGQPPRQQILCAVNGSTASAFPDTGSDLMLVSGDFVRRNGFHVERGDKFRTEIELINGSTIITDGMVLDAKLQFDIPPSYHEFDYNRYQRYMSGLSTLMGRENETHTATFICDLHLIEDLPCDVILSNDFIFQNNVFSRFRRLFYNVTTSSTTADTAIMEQGLFFVRKKVVKYSWFSWWKSCLTSDETDAVPLQGASSWEDLWEVEITRRNRIQVWISSLPEPQKSVEQRNEAHRQAVWDGQNPRPVPGLAPSSDPILRRTAVAATTANSLLLPGAPGISASLVSGAAA